jgi:hypothetical protein
MLNESNHTTHDGFGKDKGGISGGPVVVGTDAGVGIIATVGVKDGGGAIGVVLVVDAC